MNAASSAASGVSHEDLANAVRFLAADAVEAAKSGHPGMPMGMASAAAVLFTRFLKHDPAAPDWPDRDRFVLSAGHGSMLLYGLLHLTGYADMPLDELKRFRQLGARTAGHPEYGHAAGIETTTGPLGQGLAAAVGMALAERLLNARFGDDLVDHTTWAVAGDGCLMEGLSHEAVSMAGRLGLGKLIVLFDDNGICIDGRVDMAAADDQPARFAASGWHTQRVDGGDPDAVARAIESAQAETARPSLIACRTTIGLGAPNKADTAGAHGAPLGADELAGARKALGWPHAPFEIPAPVLAAWREAGTQRTGDHAEWRKRLQSSDKRAAFEAVLSGAVPEAALKALGAHKKKVAEGGAKQATRQASGDVLEVLVPEIPALTGGSADLTGSNNTKTKAMTVVTPDDFSGRYIHYGVREHGMAAAMNGMALHGGVIPYGGTFLVFADYMRGAMRLSALMGVRVIYVLTHDSIGLGEDGPTHQPVETLATLRATPNFMMFRPCDGVETAECWELALLAEKTPSGLALTRQGVPTLRTAHTDENLSARGAYVLAEASGERQVTLLATGSEVHLAIEARAALEAEGVNCAVVSMPCWELFEAQDKSYRAAVLGSAPRVACEAAVRMGWDRYIGAEGGFIGMTGFGASGPAPDLYKHFNITAEALVKEARRLIA
ncbi:MAG: transketolase [Rhodospirillales bacterium]